MYILSLDFGSTNFKAVILKITENEKEGNIKLIGKVREVITDFALFIYKILEKYNIDKKQIEKIIVTGTGSSFLDDEFEGIEIVKIDEFNAIAYGGLILARVEKGYVVSVGTGTTVIYSDMTDVRRIGGTGLGGGALVGLGNAILNDVKNGDDKITHFNTLISMSKLGNKANVDLMIGDINKGNIGDMSKDITAANFAAISKKANENDYIAAAVNMILENISLLVKALCTEDYPIIYIGTMVSDINIQDSLNNIAEYTKNKITFVNDSEYAIAIGAWEYYLLNIRKNY